MPTPELELSRLCGQILVGGFDGPDLPPRYEQALREGRRGGAILFKRNVPDLDAVLRVCDAVRRAAPADLPPFLGVDQEGGRVVRLPAPFLALPPMRVLGEIGDLALVRRAARAVGAELAAAGFNLDFAPVLDVDSNPDNPVIGDRSFGRDPRTVMRAGVAFLQGLQDKSVLACGKHFPGHGDTTKDSHHDLPVVDLPLERLRAVELAPFRAAAEAGVATLMTAHVVYTALDPKLPATLSPVACTRLRSEIGFGGVLVSDDLEMQAIAARWSVEEAAVQAVAAGCDLLLVCWSDEKQERAVEALGREAERSAAFRARCDEALVRVRRARASARAPLADEAAALALVGGAESRAVAEGMSQRAT